MESNLKPVEVNPGFHVVQLVVLLQHNSRFWSWFQVTFCAKFLHVLFMYSWLFSAYYSLLGYTKLLLNVNDSNRPGTSPGGTLTLTWIQLGLAPISLRPLMERRYRSSKDGCLILSYTCCTRYTSFLYCLLHNTMEHTNLIPLYTYVFTVHSMALQNTQRIYKEKPFSYISFLFLKCGFIHVQ